MEKDIVATSGSEASDDRESENSSLDFAYLPRQTLGDAAFEHDLLRAFQTQAAGILRQLRSHQDISAFEIANLAHLLKGTARAIGASRVGLASEPKKHEPPMQALPPRTRCGLSWLRSLKCRQSLTWPWPKHFPLSLASAASKRSL
jgi:hypothetical protein